MNISNKLTVLRLLITPIFLVFVMFVDKLPNKIMWWIVIFFIIAGITDYLDGEIARAKKQVSNFGKFIDPIADKLVVTGALLLANNLELIPIWVTMVIIFREFIISGIRLLASTKENKIISANKLGKLKTFLQFIGLISLFINATGVDNIWFLNLLIFGQWIIYLSVIISIWSGIKYFLQNWQIIKSCIQD